MYLADMIVQYSLCLKSSLQQLPTAADSCWHDLDCWLGQHSAARDSWDSQLKLTTAHTNLDQSSGGDNDDIGLSDKDEKILQWQSEFTNHLTSLLFISTAYKLFTTKLVRKW